MDNYDEMSDADINRLLILTLNPAAVRDAELHLHRNRSTITGVSNLFTVTWPNYCGNWGDIGPLIDEYKVDIEHPVESLGNIGQCTIYRDGNTDIIHEYKCNPKRSAAICVIELLEANNEPQP